MNPNNNTITYSALLTRFQNSWLRDNTNLTWTTAEIKECLLAALDDASSFFIDVDSTTTTVAQQAQYAVPSQFSNVTDLLIDAAGDGYWTHIDRAAYKVINGSIIFERYYKQMPGGKTLVVYGRRQLTANDSIPETFVPFLLHTARAEAFDLLRTTLSSRFLKNDMTMAELINSANIDRQKAEQLKKGLINRYAVEV